MDVERTYICDVCKKKSTKASKSKIYCRVSSLESSFVCAECSNLFSMAFEVTDIESLPDEYEEESQLLFDILSDDSASDDPSYTDEEHAKSLQKDSKDKPHKCRICTKSFKARWLLTRHMNIHKGIYKCEKCNKCLASKSALKYHLRKHSNEKPYKCDICPAIFKYPKNLLIHMRIHKGTFKCEKCNKSFSSKDILERHLQRHVSAKVYKCDICTSTFKHVTHLRKHRLDCLKF